MRRRTKVRGRRLDTRYKMEGRLIYMFLISNKIFILQSCLWFLSLFLCLSRTFFLPALRIVFLVMRSPLIILLPPPPKLTNLFLSTSFPADRNPYVIIGINCGYQDLVETEVWWDRRAHIGTYNNAIHSSPRRL